MKTYPGIYTEQELLDELMTIYLAAQDTTTTISAFAFLMMGAYPEIQDKMYNEVLSVRGPDHIPLTMKTAKELPYTDMFIKEVLRVFPVCPYIVRQSYEDFTLEDGVIIPARCAVVVGINGVHRQHEHYERPNSFYPEHFMPKIAAARHPSAYLPFSQGMRSCVGQLYANLCLKVILSGVLLNYKVVSDRKFENVRLKTDISVGLEMATR